MNRRNFLSVVGCATAVGYLSDYLPAFAGDVATGLPVPSIWGKGQLLAFSGLDGPTDYKAGLVARSSAHPTGLSIMLPAEMTIQFGDHPMGEVQLTSDSFLLTTEQGKVRGAFVDAHHLLIEGPCEITHKSSELEVACRKSLTLIGSRSHFNPKLLRSDLTRLIKQRQRWLRQQIPPSNRDEQRLRTLAKAISVMKGQVCTPEGLIRHRWTTPDRWPHRDLWLWDSVFHAIGWRHLDKKLAREMIEAVFDGQQPDGRIPLSFNPFKAISITQPPVLALGIQMAVGREPDAQWLENMYPRLARYLEWDFTHRVVPAGGLAQWFIQGDPLSRSGESGMDNSPRFDAAVGLDAVDFNAFLSLECAVMAEFARQLGRPAEVELWSGRHKELNRLINERLWNEAEGFYFDYDPAQKQQTGIMAVSGFLPLLCGAANENQVRRLAAHLDNPKTFGTAVPLATAVLTTETKNPGDMWRGPVWINMNWLVALGFERSGRKDVALNLRRKTLREVERRYLELGSLFEFFDETGKLSPDRLPRKGVNDPQDPYHQTMHDFGWTATLYADLAYTTP